MPLGTLAAQLVHAAGESVSEPLPDNTRAVVLAAKDESHLLKIEQKLQHRGIPHRSIREPDSPWCNSLMSIGLEPVADRRAVRRVLSNLPLLRERKKE